MGFSFLTGGKGTNPLKKIISVVVLSCGLLIILGYFGYSYFTGLLKPVGGPDDNRKVTVTVPQGANSAQIAKTLYDQGLIRDPRVFRIYASYRNLDGKLQAGEYEFDTSLSTPEIIQRLARGETSSYFFTIPEGFNLEQIADRLAEKKLVDRDRFLELAAYGDFDYDFLQGIPKGPKRLEGYLFPDTYRVTANTSEEEIINLMLARFAKEISKYNFEAEAAKQGLTLHEAVTLASMVEREAQRDEERPKVAAVFLNRLKKGWKMESCATVQYALGQPKARLLEKDLKIESPYNTYKYKGFPPGPIASPGGPSLQAVIRPADVDYMFFVVADDGKHIFSRTLAEHNRNKAAYLQRLKEEQE